jgi:hypothetical protein
MRPAGNSLVFGLTRIMSGRVRAFLYICFVLCLALIGLAIRGGQAEAQSARGVTVSPAMKEVDINPEDTEVSFTFDITNRNLAAITAKLSSIDFGSLDESGGIAFIGSANDPKSTRYGLHEWLSFSTDTVTVQPGRTQTVTAMVANRTSLAPGGHYGAIVITPVKEDPQAKSTKVELVPSSSVLVFARKVGGEVYDLQISRMDAGGSWFRRPQEAAVRFQNAGNVHVVPRGIVSMRDPRGRVIARGIINTDSGAILPESFRRYTVPLETVGSSWFPGKYSVVAQWRYDGQESFKESVVEFYYIGAFFYLLIAILCFIVLCIVVIKYKLWRKLFHRRGKR